MPARVIINEGNVVAFIMPGGEVSRDVGEIAKNTRTFARLHAPKRTGKLARYIAAGNPIPRPPYHTSATASANVKYAKYVHEGTPPMIHPNGKWLKLTPAWGPYAVSYKKAVRGQEANPFLARGLRDAMSIYR